MYISLRDIIMYGNFPKLLVSRWPDVEVRLVDSVGVFGCVDQELGFL